MQRLKWTGQTGKRRACCTSLCDQAQALSALQDWQPRFLLLHACKPFTSVDSSMAFSLSPAMYEFLLLSDICAPVEGSLLLSQAPIFTGYSPSSTMDPHMCLPQPEQHRGASY